MKTRVFIVLLFLAAFAFGAANVNAQGTYSAKLISPRLGQVLHQGQQFRIEWKATFPNIHLNGSEMEIWLSLDGGRTYTMRPSMDPNTTYFYSTVPSTPTNSAVLDTRFGCEGPSYPDGFNPQTTSAFMIAGAGSQ